MEGDDGSRRLGFYRHAAQYYLSGQERHDGSASAGDESVLAVTAPTQGDGPQDHEPHEGSDNAVRVLDHHLGLRGRHHAAMAQGPVGTGRPRIGCSDGTAEDDEAPDGYGRNDGQPAIVEPHAPLGFG